MNELWVVELETKRGWFIACINGSPSVHADRVEAEMAMVDERLHASQLRYVDRRVRVSKWVREGDQ